MSTYLGPLQSLVSTVNFSLSEWYLVEPVEGAFHFFLFKPNCKLALTYFY